MKDADFYGKSRIPLQLPPLMFSSRPLLRRDDGDGDGDGDGDNKACLGSI